MFLRTTATAKQNRDREAGGMPAHCWIAATCKVTSEHLLSAVCSGGKAQASRTQGLSLRPYGTCVFWLPHAVRQLTCQECRCCWREEATWEIWKDGMGLPLRSPLSLSVLGLQDWQVKSWWTRIHSLTGASYSCSYFRSGVCVFFIPPEIPAWLRNRLVVLRHLIIISFAFPHL